MSLIKKYSQKKNTGNIKNNISGFMRKRAMRTIFGTDTHTHAPDKGDVN